MGSLKLTTASSGSVILSPANTASDVTIQVPAVTGTMAINGPAFSAYSVSGQSVTSGVVTKVILNGEDFDTASCFDSSTNYRFTPNVAGYYQISGTIGNNSTTTQSGIGVYIYKNGSSVAQVTINNNNQFNNCSTTVSKLIYLNGSTDYIELYGYTTSSSGPRFDLGSAITYMTGSLVRAA